MPNSLVRTPAQEKRWSAAKKAAAKSKSKSVADLEGDDYALVNHIYQQMGEAELLKGGKADGRSPKDFDQAQLRAGIKVEMEHTDDKAKATEIAMDHLTEDPDYYRKLSTIDKDALDAESGSTRGARMELRLIEAGMLDPKVWDAQDNLNPLLRSALLSVADDAVSIVTKDWGFPVAVSQRILTGSETSPDYDDQSDLDLHIVVDLSQAPDPKATKAALDLFAKTYNSRGLKYKGKDVEIYFQDKDAELIAPGVYDLDAGLWVQKPGDEKHPASDEAKRIADSYKDRAHHLAAKYDLGAEEMTPELLQGFLSQARALTSEIRGLRRDGLAKGLYGDGNVAFKLLRRNGTFDTLNRLMTQAQNRLLTGE